MVDYMRHQQPKIEAIKNIIKKFDDKKAPIMSSACLEFRRLFSLRQSCVNTESFGSRLTIKEWNVFYHISSCDSCTFYAMLHKNDSPIATELKEEISQKEFEQGLDEFFNETKQHGDSFEAYEERQGLKPIPQELMRHLSSEYGKQEKAE